MNLIVAMSENTRRRNQVGRTPTEDLLFKYARSQDSALNEGSLQVVFRPSHPYLWTVSRTSTTTHKVTLVYGGEVSVEAIEEAFLNLLGAVRELRSKENHYPLVAISKHR